MKAISTYLLVCLIFFSCNDRSSAEAILGNDSGLFRGVSVNDSPEKVKAAEDYDALLIDEKFTLKYQYHYSNVEIEINYAFDDRGLYKIETFGRCTSKKEQELLFNDFESYYTSKYGTPMLGHEAKNWLAQNKSIIVELRKLNASTDIALTIEALE